MTEVDFRHGPASTVAEALHSATSVSAGDLRAALANALERIASIEKDWDELGQLFKAFNEQVDAAKLHGTDVLRDQ